MTKADICGVSGICLSLPGGSDSKESACNTGDLGSIPESGRSPGEGKGYPLQYSCLENPMGEGAWRATVHGVAQSDMTEATYTHTHTHTHTEGLQTFVRIPLEISKNHQIGKYHDTLSFLHKHRLFYSYAASLL